MIRNREYGEEKDRKKYLTSYILVNLVECTFVQAQTENSFFLTFDPADEFAVFMLIKDDRANDEEFFVAGRAHNVSVMKYATDVY